jgi:(S)-6-hydroxynicotine oxidase
MSDDPRVDVAVVGAGLAGATAAAELTARGLSVVVLEARDRLGGRGYCRPFDGDGELVDFGGAWITPWQRNIRDLCARHDIGLQPRHPVTAHRWIRDVDDNERNRHEAALARLAADAARSGEGGRLTLAAYLDSIEAPQATRDLVSAWWTVTGNGDKERVPASELLSSMAHGDGTLEGISLPWADTLEGGVSLLVERVLAASGAELRKACPVVRIIQEPDVVIHAGAGESVRASAAVIATGINPLRSVEIEPPLTDAKRDALAIGHLGRAVKVWAEVRGVAAGMLATGGGHGVEWMFAERETSRGTTLLVGFGVADGPFAIEHEAQAAVTRLFPEAQLVALDWHDWNEDPYAQGTWVASVAGAEDALAASTWHAEGRLAFASSDIAEDDQGWFEGAVVSGKRAANALAETIG